MDSFLTVDLFVDATIFIDAGTKAIRLLRSTADNSPKNEIENLANYLHHFLDNFASRLSHYSSQEGVITSSDYSLMRESHGLALEISRVLDSFNQPSTKMTAFGFMLKKLWYQSEIEKLDRRLVQISEKLQMTLYGNQCRSFQFCDTMRITTSIG